MKISARQVRAALDAYVCSRSARTHGATGDSRRDPILEATSGFRRELDLMPEERDIVVHDLRSKISAGSYFVSGPDIVDALLGRLVADLISE